MNRKQNPNAVAVRVCTASPESVDEACITEERALAVAADAPCFLSGRVSAAFADAGFSVQRIQREEFHQSVWNVWLIRESLGLPRDSHAASKELRQVLAKCGLKIRPGEITVLEQRGNKLRCAFIFGPDSPLVDV